MGDRRSQLLDAGLELIAAQGMGGLTHEAVDATAHVPAGCTEELFPTREALIQGVTQRCIERELEMATGPGPEIEASPEGIAAAFGAFALRALGDDRVVTLARYALHAEAARPLRSVPSTPSALTRLTPGRSTSSAAPERATPSATSASWPTTSRDWCSTSSPCRRPSSTLSSGSASSSTSLAGAPRDRYRQPVHADPEPARGLHRHA